MANISNVRKLFADELKSIDSEYREHQDAFPTDNIGKNNYNKTFHINFYDLVGSTLSHVTTREQIKVKVKLFRKGFRDPQQAADDLFDFTNKYRLSMMKPKDYKVPFMHILKIFCEGFTISGLDTNDNSIYAEANFVVDVVFGTEENQDC